MDLYLQDMIRSLESNRWIFSTSTPRANQYKFASNNGLDVEILTGQQSFRIKSFLTANCWVIIEENQLELDREDKVNIYPQTAGQWQF